MTKDNIRIVSDGTPRGTSVFNYDGSEMVGIRSIKFEIGADFLATAEIVFLNVEAEIVAKWKSHPLKNWANRRTGKL